MSAVPTIAQYQSLTNRRMVAESAPCLTYLTHAFKKKLKYISLCVLMAQRVGTNVVAITADDNLVFISFSSTG